MHYDETLEKIDTLIVALFPFALVMGGIADSFETAKTLGDLTVKEIYENYSADEMPDNIKADYKRSLSKALTCQKAHKDSNTITDPEMVNNRFNVHYSFLSLQKLLDNDNNINKNSTNNYII